MTGAFEGKTVLVTGASAGIGLAAARTFAREGARVLAVARSKERLDALAAEAGLEGSIVPLPADVADPAAMVALGEAVLRDHGPPDVVVANAGIGLDSLFWETPDDELRRVLEVNVLGVARTIRPFLPGMIARGSGRVLIVSSVLGKRGIPHYSAYSASKFALHGMADALRPELAGTGVSVGLVCPSSTESEFSSRMKRVGPTQKRTRVAYHSAKSVARAILRMARSRRREMVLSPEGKLMVLLNAAAPGLLDRILGRVLTRR
ncbi:MAG: SDR family NAD(P)-dependent oxidoreductase [Acidobacteriia bacterium]|nr:SDR family NAD(P)-dependent oxidoreductase [Terriglobia bacterium]